MSDFAFLADPTIYDGDCSYEPGDIVKESGIYAICHSDGTREPIVLIRGREFPNCDCCGVDVRYRLIRSAPYIFDDPDFNPVV